MSAPAISPFPVYLVAGRFLLYDVNVVSRVRKTHHMCGFLTGTLPQIPQQNVFLGLPLELMTEEAALLVETGAAYIVDDVDAHRRGLQEMKEADKKRYLERREEEAVKEALAHQAVQTQRAAAARAKIAEMKDVKTQDEEVSRTTSTEALQIQVQKEPEEERPEKLEGGLFAHTLIPRCNSSIVGQPKTTLRSSPVPVSPLSPDLSAEYIISPSLSPRRISAETVRQPATPVSSSLAPALFADVLIRSRSPSPSPMPTPVSPGPVPPSFRYHHTPTVSTPPYHLPSHSSHVPQPRKSAYELYKHLHSQGYFLGPGLRFGCQFAAYPGDPLRFHSHFLCDGFGWDEEMDLIEVVTGGRLGTGVKKAWVFGGAKEEDGKERGEGRVRTFSVEWGGY